MSKQVSPVSTLSCEIDVPLPPPYDINALCVCVLCGAPKNNTIFFCYKNLVLINATPCFVSVVFSNFFWGGGWLFKKVVVLFDYDAASAEELSLRENDIVTVIYEDPSGWWEGELNGIKGIFPSNFCQPYTAVGPPPPHNLAPTFKDSSMFVMNSLLWLCSL